MKTKDRLLPFLLALVLAAVLAPAALAGEGCDEAGELKEMCTTLQDWANRTINNAKFVDDCLGFAVEPEECDAADAPGGGLVCPEAPKATVIDHACQILTTAGFKAGLGTKAGQILDLAGKFSVHFAMIGEEKSIPTHHHEQTCDGSGSCAKEYIKRQEKVTVFFAASQKGKMSVAPLDSFEKLKDFKASIDTEKVTYFQVTNHHYCNKVEHGEPLTCAKGPTTGGGTQEPQEPQCTDGGCEEPPADECPQDPTGTSDETQPVEG